MRRAKWERIGQLALSLLILLLLLRYIDFGLLDLALRQAKLFYMIVVLATVPATFLPRVYRWALIINRTGQHVAFKTLYLLTLVGVCLNFLLPASLGDIAKSYYGYRQTGLKEEMLSSTLVDKFIAIFSIFLLGSVAALVYGLGIYAGLSVFLCVVFGVLSFAPNLLPWHWLHRIPVNALHKSLSVHRLREAYILPTRTKVLAVVWSLVGWFITYLGFYLLCLAFSADLQFVYVFAVAPMIVLARTFPFTLSGLGTQEAVVVLLFSQIGVNSANALLVSMSFTIITSVIPALVGLLIILWWGVKKHEPVKPSVDCR